MNKEIIQQIYYYFIDRKLRPRLSCFYGEDIFSLTSYSFCSGNFDKHKDTTDYSIYLLFNFIQECLKKDNKCKSTIRLYNAPEVEEFVEHIRKFVTDQHYLKEFNNTVKECLHYKNSNTSNCSSLSEVRENIIEEGLEIITGNRTHDDLFSDHHIIGIFSMTVALFTFVFITAAFYAICSKFRSIYKHQLPKKEMIEMSVISKDEMGKRL